MDFNSWGCSPDSSLLDLCKSQPELGKIKLSFPIRSMTIEQVENLKPTEFKRFCGVSKETFKDMVTVLEAEKVLPKKTGRLPTQPECIQAGKRECIPHRTN